MSAWRAELLATRKTGTPRRMLNVTVRWRVDWFLIFSGGWFVFLAWYVWRYLGPVPV